MAEGKHQCEEHWNQPGYAAGWGTLSLELRWSGPALLLPAPTPASLRQYGKEGALSLEQTGFSPPMEQSARGQWCLLRAVSRSCPSLSPHPGFREAAGPCLARGPTVPMEAREADTFLGPHSGGDCSHSTVRCIACRVGEAATAGDCDCYKYPCPEASTCAELQCAAPEHQEPTSAGQRLLSSGPPASSCHPASLQ